MRRGNDAWNEGSVLCQSMKDTTGEDIDVHARL